MASMKGKTVVITGANQGIGKATAVGLARLGARLVLICRNPDKARAAVADIKAEAGSSEVELLLADLSSQAEVRRVAGEVDQACSRIDVLINNAGVLVPTRLLTVDGIETTFATNHLGYFLLTELLLPKLRASAPARIINVASTAHQRASIDWDDIGHARSYRQFTAYGQSKLANILFTYELARRLEGSGVTVNCLHPGVVRTGFGHTYGGLISLAVRIASPFFISADAGAETSIYLASSPEVVGVSGKYFVKRKQKRSNAASYDTAAAARLWTLSEELTRRQA
jgi:NAD(P)-dependent dehydrogenase (short-subunit alcohol dehydrogenase family)